MKKSSPTVIGEYKLEESGYDDKPEVGPSESTDQSRVIEDGEPATLTVDEDLPSTDPQVTVSA